jgi:hypothetical protein
MDTIMNNYEYWINFSHEPHKIYNGKYFCISKQALGAFLSDVSW